MILGNLVEEGKPLVVLEWKQIKDPQPAANEDKTYPNDGPKEAA